MLPGTLTAQSFKEVWVLNDEVNLYVKVFGEGNPLILINGGPGMNSNGFNALAEILANTNTVYLYDQRGTGKSVMEEVNEQNMTMEAMVDDLEAIREHFNIDTWIVYGHSFGGMLAYKYAAEHPEHTWAMVQSSSGGMDLSIRENIRINERLSQTELDSLEYWTDAIEGGDTSENATMKRLYFLASAYVYNDEHIHIIRDRLTQANLEINAMLWEDMVSTEFDQSDALEYFDSPVLILIGEYDMVDISLAEDADDWLPDSELVIIKNSGHYGWVDHPEQYNTVVLNFLRSLPNIPE